MLGDCASCGLELDKADVMAECYNEQGELICVACEYSQ